MIVKTILDEKDIIDLIRDKFNLTEQDQIIFRVEPLYQGYAETIVGHTCRFEFTKNA